MLNKTRDALKQSEDAVQVSSLLEKKMVIVVIFIEKKPFIIFGALD